MTTLARAPLACITTNVRSENQGPASAPVRRSGRRKSSVDQSQRTPLKSIRHQRTASQQSVIARPKGHIKNSASLDISADGRASVNTLLRDAASSKDSVTQSPTIASKQNTGSATLKAQATPCTIADSVNARLDANRRRRAATISHAQNIAKRNLSISSLAIAAAGQPSTVSNDRTPAATLLQNQAGLPPVEFKLPLSTYLQFQDGHARTQSDSRAELDNVEVLMRQFVMLDGTPARPTAPVEEQLPVQACSLSQYGPLPAWPAMPLEAPPMQRDGPSQSLESVWQASIDQAQLHISQSATHFPYSPYLDGRADSSACSGATYGFTYAPSLPDSRRSSLMCSRSESISAFDTQQPFDPAWNRWPSYASFESESPSMSAMASMRSSINASASHSGVDALSRLALGRPRRPTTSVTEVPESVEQLSQIIATLSAALPSATSIPQYKLDALQTAANALSQETLVSPLEVEYQPNHVPITL